MVQFKLGSDPELMLRDSKTKALRSAIPIIPEGKGAGRKLGKSGYNTILHDNVLVELNTEPALTQGEFVSTIGYALNEGQKIVAKSGLELFLLTSVNFPEKELQDPEAKIFGCEPDYDAYLLEINVVPAEASRKPFRSTGGHLHIGKHGNGGALDELLDDPLGKVLVVKALDTIVGIPSIFLDKDPTSGPRRQLYGRAGSHRPTTYGVEWRACGSWWLASPAHTKLVYNLTAAALSVVVDDAAFSKLTVNLGGEDAIQEIINKSKVADAREAYKKFISPLLSPDVRKEVGTLDGTDQIDLRKAWGI